MTRHRTAAMLLAALLTAGLTGCAGSPTQQSTGEFIDDGVVTARVKTALIQDEVTKARQINVETFKGVVQLSGFVESNRERVRALEVARKVDGVKEVRDSLQLRKST